MLTKSRERIERRLAKLHAHSFRDHLEKLFLLGSVHLIARDKRHESVDHSADEWVKCDAHTNCLENFWTLLKRSLKGTYVAVAPFHLFRYVHEQAFRFNNRLMDDFERFWQALSQVTGKRITYRLLTAKDDAGFMGIK
jgi:hypothetical protein